MKNPKLKLPMLIIIGGVIVSIIANMVLCIAKKPAIAEHSFPISITYEFDGKTVTIEDEFICTYTGHGASTNSTNRYYDGYLANADDINCGDYLIEAYDDGELIIITNLFEGYMMGDPQYDNHYTDYYRCEPYVAFYDYEEYREFEEPEYLEPYNVKIVDWEYPEPLENDFVFSRIGRLGPTNAVANIVVGVLALLACMIFVKKDSDYTSTAMNKLSTVLNFGIGLIVFPFLSIVAPFSDINGSGEDLISQIFYCIPLITALGLAASICLRRKGFEKASFLSQFTGVVLTAVLLLLESIL